MKPKQRAFMLADTMVGMLIIAGLTVSVAVVGGWQRRASRQMNDLRVATDLAETTLVDLHQGRPLEPAGSGMSVKVEPVTGGCNIAGFSWCRVIATVNGRSVTLVGLRAEKGGR